MPSIRKEVPAAARDVVEQVREGGVVVSGDAQLDDLEDRCSAVRSSVERTVTSRSSIFVAMRTVAPPHRRISRPRTPDSPSGPDTPQSRQAAVVAADLAQRGRLRQTPARSGAAELHEPAEPYRRTTVVAAEHVDEHGRAVTGTGEEHDALHVVARTRILEMITCPSDRTRVRGRLPAETCWGAGTLRAALAQHQD